jgi:hypothetical protein
VQLAAEVFHSFAATDAIVGRARKITGLFPALIAHAGDRSRVNGRRRFCLERLAHELQAHAHGQDHRPQVALAAIVAAAFIESGKEGPQTGLMQPQEVIFSWFSNQFLIESDGDHLAVRETWSWTRPL